MSAEIYNVDSKVYLDHYLVCSTTVFDVSIVIFITIATIFS
jgi:hypothetical protein